MLNGLMAVAAIVTALVFGGGLDKIEQVACEVSFELTPYSLEMHVDPVFRVWGDSPASALTFANVIVMDESLRGTKQEAYILHHEMNHVRQFQALGVAWYPASLVLPMEWWPSRTQVQWDNPAQSDEFMWQPPTWWRDMWHFFTVGIRLG